MNYQCAKSCVALFLLCLLVLCGVWPVTEAAADLYRWRDDQGRWHFSDSPQNVPAQIRQKAREPQTELGNLSIISTTPSKTQNKSEQKGAVSKGEEISIPFIANEGYADRVIINITFNDSVTAPILVDTGSPGLVITSDLATRLGLIDPDGNNLLVLISGIGGREIAAKAIVDKINIGNITETFIPTHIIKPASTAYQGLIGMDILSQYSLTIDSANRRLIAKKLPPSENRPGGHNSRWWQKNFKELIYYMSFWDQQAELIDSHNSPYSSLTSRYDKVKSFILTQKEESKKLYKRLDRHARRHSVPRHWRR
jgi:Aspartyl protease/Domain of unknown function (DUF4124)